MKYCIYTHSYLLVKLLIRDLSLSVSFGSFVFMRFRIVFAIVCKTIRCNNGCGTNMVHTNDSRRVGSIKAPYWQKVMETLEARSLLFL